MDCCESEEDHADHTKFAGHAAAQRAAGHTGEAKGTQPGVAINAGRLGLFFLETHLTPGNTKDLGNQISVHEVVVAGVPGGLRLQRLPEAGIAALWRLGLNPWLWGGSFLNTLRSCTYENSHWFPVRVRSRSERITVVGIDAKELVGYWSPSPNVDLVSESMAFWAVAGNEAIAFGDWNDTLDVVAACLKLLHSDWVIVVPNVTQTCHTGGARLLEFGICTPARASRINVFPEVIEFSAHFAFSVSISHTSVRSKCRRFKNMCGPKNCYSLLLLTWLLSTIATGSSFPLLTKCSRGSRETAGAELANQRFSLTYIWTVSTYKHP